MTMGPEAYDGEERRAGPTDRRIYAQCPHYEKCPARTQEHQEDHQMVRCAMRFFSRLENTRWIVFNTIIVGVILLLLGSLGIGLLEKLGDALGI